MADSGNCRRLQHQRRRPPPLKSYCSRRQMSWPKSAERRGRRITGTQPCVCRRKDPSSLGGGIGKPIRTMSPQQCQAELLGNKGVTEGRHWADLINRWITCISIDAQNNHRIHFHLPLQTFPIIYDQFRKLQLRIIRTAKKQGGFLPFRQRKQLYTRNKTFF